MGQGTHDCRDINAGSAEAGLTETHIRIHRDAWEHFHALTLTPSAQNQCAVPCGTFDYSVFKMMSPRRGQNREDSGGRQ